MNEARWVETNNTINSISNILSKMFLSLLLVDLPLIFPSEIQTEHEGYPSQTYPKEKTTPFSPPLYQFCEVEQSFLKLHIPVMEKQSLGKQITSWLLKQTPQECFGLFFLFITTKIKAFLFQNYSNLLSRTSNITL